MTDRERDNCEFCLGAKGGVKGNENVLRNGVVACDYCTVLVDKATQTGFYSPDKLTAALALKAEVDKTLRQMDGGSQ